jgi:hypothetical protein
MRLAEHEVKGDNKDLITLVIANVQDPVTPVFEAALVGEGLHDAGCMIACLGKIVYCGAATVDENLLCVGAVEIDLGHVQPPSNGTGSHEISALPVFLVARYKVQKR